ncbi:porin [bacterium]|nr:porin [bacterium]
MKKSLLYLILLVSPPYAFADLTWAPASYAPKESFLATKYFTPELRLDAVYHHSFNHPSDGTISGSSEVLRHGELQLTQIGVGGDFTYGNVGFRIMTQFGLYSTATPRNDASPSRGQWNLDSAYRYISEAYASYHLDVLEGINLQAGIFMSYIGLWSYYNFDNWTYQPSYVSSNTPWFFNGVRAQIFPNEKLKIEPWIVNGWQSYGRFNNQPGLGVQVLYRPNERLSMVGNQYYGADTLNNPARKRLHSDNSIMWKYYESPGATVSKSAASLTLDLGCEDGGGVSCGSQYFLGFMAYNRTWILDDTVGITFGGGYIKNPGRYLVILPPINGATAFSGTPYFTANPGDDYSAWDVQLTADYLVTPNLTFRLEFNHRWASVPYFTGPGGVTPPGGNSGTPGSDPGGGWSPDLRQAEDRLTLGMLVRL